MIADPYPKSNVYPVLAGQRQQQLRICGLYISRCGGEQRHRPFGRSELDVFDTAQPPIHHGQSVQFHQFADRVDLDGVREVVREIYDHGQAGEQQHQRPADRQSRKFLGPPAGG